MLLNGNFLDRVYLWLTPISSSKSSLLGLLNTGITGMCLHIWFYMTIS